MAHSRQGLAAVLTSLMLAGAPALAASSAVLVQQSGMTFETAGQFTLGFEFMVTQDLRVTALGVYDGGLPGLESAAQVSLWIDDLAGTLLASTSVAAGTAAPLIDQFRQQAIAPVLLTPGVRYVVGAYLPGGLATSFNFDGGAQGSFDARLTQVMDRYWSDFDPAGNGNDYPIDSGFQAGGAYLGASFLLAPVPEPAPAALLAAGVLALGLLKQRRSARR
jgi:hypothetical protein